MKKFAPVSVQLNSLLLWVLILSIFVFSFLYGSYHPPEVLSIPPPSEFSEEFLQEKSHLTQRLIRTSPPSDPHTPWIETLSWKPRVFLYHNFLRPEECDEIVKLAEDDVSRSLVVGDKGKSVESTARTSSGVFLIDKYMKVSPLLRVMEKRIAEWTNLPVENGEAFYLLRYEIGQEYKPHNDWFSKSADGGPFKHEHGNRYATVLTYLQSPTEGGSTVFPHANLRVPAKKGDSVLFWDLLPTNEGDPDSLHGGEPVISGTKWAMTKWIRESKFWRYEDHMTEEEKQQLEDDEIDVRVTNLKKNIESISSNNIITI